MRQLIVSILLAAAGTGCTKKNPEICCETESECAAVGFTSKQFCGSDSRPDGVCVDNMCVATGCDGNEDCHDPDLPTCISGSCGKTSTDPCLAAGGRLAFISNRDGDRDVYVSNADGTSPTVITHDGVDELDPLWSPDGSKIAFLMGGDVFVVNANGDGAQNVSNTPDLDQHAVWSPDGTMLAFDTIHTGLGSTSVVTAAGVLVTTIASTGQASNDQPSWSPDQTKIVFASGPSPTSDLGLWSVALTPQAIPTTLFTTIATDAYTSPQSSPDGKKIAFISSHDGNPDLWLMNPNGSGAANLTSSAEAETELTWSPDSSKIAFVRQLTDGSDVWVVHADGTGPSNLTQGSRHNTHPRWSPDGSRIVFQTDRDGNNEIYVMMADGTDPQDLTKDPGEDTSPEWTQSCP